MRSLRASPGSRRHDSGTGTQRLNRDGTARRGRSSRARAGLRPVEHGGGSAQAGTHEKAPARRAGASRVWGLAGRSVAIGAWARAVGAGAAAEFALMLAEAVVLAAEALVDIFPAALRHLVGVAHALLAHLVRPLSKHLVLAAGAREKRAEQQTRRQADETHHHGVLGDVVLHVAPCVIEAAQGSSGTHVVGGPGARALIGVLHPLRSLVIGSTGPLAGLAGGLLHGLGRALGLAMAPLVLVGLAGRRPGTLVACARLATERGRGMRGERRALRRLAGAGLLRHRRRLAHRSDGGPGRDLGGRDRIGARPFGLAGHG